MQVADRQKMKKLTLQRQFCLWLNVLCMFNY